MGIDPRLNDIDDCLYRVAARIVVMRGDKVLIVKEAGHQNWWAFPGGGIDHHETATQALVRELTEELAVSAESITAGPELLHYSIGAVLLGVPRMNLFFRVELSTEPQTTSEIVELMWCNREEFLVAKLNESYDKPTLADAIFG